MRVISTPLAISMAAIALTAAAPVVAKEKLANAAIMSGDFNTAERILIDQPNAFKSMPEVLINLAFVYANTGREAEARALYREVLRQPDVDLDNTMGQSVSSREIARVGLARLTLGSR
ncbi:MAG: tetratricopeptide repeat protein [Sphingomonas sp.]